MLPRVGVVATRFWATVGALFLLLAAGCTLPSGHNVGTLLDASGPIALHEPSIFVATSVDVARALVVGVKECPVPAYPHDDCWRSKYPDGMVFVAAAPPGGCGWSDWSLSLAGSTVTVSGSVVRCAPGVAAALQPYRLFGIRIPDLPRAIVTFVTAGDLQPGRALIDLRTAGAADVSVDAAALAVATAPIQARIDAVRAAGPVSEVDLGSWDHCQPAPVHAVAPTIRVTVTYGSDAHYQWNGSGVDLCDGLHGDPLATSGLVAIARLPVGLQVESVELTSPDRHDGARPTGGGSSTIAIGPDLRPGTYGISILASDTPSHPFSVPVTPSTVTLVPGRVTAITLDARPD